MTDSLLSPILLAAAVAVFAHACFQLAVSVLTLLSSHSLGLGRSHLRVLSLCFAYTVGAFVGTALITIAAISALNTVLLYTTTESVRLSIAALSIGVGLTVILYYYRSGKGTMLWVPRGAMNYLSGRAKKTKYSFEAFGLGLLTIIVELPFLIAPISIMALVISIINPFRIDLPLAYSALVTLPLLVVTGLVGSGHSISTIQRWREANKTFLQFTGGGALIVLGFFLLMNYLNIGGRP